MTYVNASLPLVDLHRHLDGNVRPSTIWELSKKYDIPINASCEADVESLVYIKDKSSDLLAFLEKLDTGVSVLCTEDDCKRIAYENVQDAFYECLDYVELRFSPYYMALSHGLPLEGVVESVVEGIHTGLKEFDIKAQPIGILSRTFGTAACQRELDALLSCSDALCGIDLAGDELNYPADDFVEHFKQARDKGLQITVHAGEADGPQSIWNAILKLGATRIGHGVAAIQDEALMAYLAKHAIGIEACPTSNYQTGTVVDTASHPLKTFLDRGICVTLNTDDPGVSNISLKDEYKLVSDVVGLSEKSLEQIQKNGVMQAFLSDDEKRALFATARSRLSRTP